MKVRSPRTLARSAVAGLVLAAAVVVGASAWTPAAAAPSRGAAPQAAQQPAYTPTISVSPTSGGPGSTVRLKASGYKPSDAIYVYVGSTYMCGLTPNASGVVPGTTCTVPSTPHGAVTLSGQQDSNTITATTSFTVTSRITYINYAAVSPGAVVTLNAGGLASSAALSAKVDAATATTNPPAISSDASGSVGNLQVTIPAGTAAGTHTLAIRDSAGNQATTTITVYTPTFSVSPANVAAGSTLSVTGSGWKPVNTIYVYANTTYFCAVTPSATGAINATCPAPTAPYGSEVFSGQQSGTAISATQAGSITPGITYLSSDSASRGGTVYLTAGGLAASSAVTVTISGYTGNLVTNPVSLSTDGNGSTGGLYVTLPTSTSLAAGSHTLSVNDANGHSATTTLTIYVPTLTVASTGVPGKPISISGSKFRPGDTVYLYLGTTYFGGVTTDSTGSFAFTPNLPAAPVGPTTLSAYEDTAYANSIVVSKAFTVKPGVSYQSAQFIGPGSSFTVNVGGLDPSVGFTTTVGKTTATTSGPTTTDTNGSINNLSITIPAGTKAGSTTITIKDKASKAQSVKIVVQVYAPTLAVSPASGPPNSPLHVTGAGWRPDDTVYLKFTSTTTAYTTTYCGVHSDGNGAVNGYCNEAAIPAGGYTILGEQDGTNITAAVAGTFTETPGYYSVTSTVVSGHGTEQLYVQGLAASSAVTVALDGTALVVTAGNPTTDTNGSVGYLTVTLPATLATGSHTLTVTDAAGNVASEVLMAVTPTVTLSDTTIPAGTAFAVNGAGFDGGPSVYFYLDGTYFCGLGTDASGNLSGSCTIPAGTAAGSHTLSAQQDSDAVQVNTTITTS